MTVACLGDSNTAEGWPTANTIRWCEMAAAAQPTATVWRYRQLVTEPTAGLNVAVGGATVCPLPGWSWSFSQLMIAKAHGADVVIAAFGSNDLFGLRKTPAEIVQCYRDLVALAGPLPLYIALTPPVFNKIDPGYDAMVQALNDALRAAFPPSQLIDFYTDFTADDFTGDGVHLDLDLGQPKRAAIALSFLEAK